MNAVVKQEADVRDYWNLPRGTGMASPAEQVAHVYALHPQLHQAAGAQTLERVSGTFRFDPSAEFAKLVAQVERKEFAYRVPATVAEAQSLVVLRGGGNCQEPILAPSDMHYFDPTIEARAGDFVLVVWDQQFYNEGVASGRWSKWCLEFGAPSPFATKMLKRIGNHWLLTTNNGAYDLFDIVKQRPNAKIVGVLRRTERGGAPIYDRNDITPVAHCIGQNAATEVAINSDAGPVSYVTVLGNGDAQGWGCRTTVTAPMDCDVIVTCVCQLEMNLYITQTFVSARIEELSSPFGVQQEEQEAKILVAGATGQTQAVMARMTGSIVQGISYDVGLWLRVVDGGGVSGNEVRSTEMYVTCELIKR